jgi:hypothetical protein
MKIGKDIINFYDGSPPQGLSEPRRGSSVFSEIKVVDPPRGVPSGAAADIITGGMGVSTPIILSERIRFNMELSFENFHPVCL